jgi:DNA modification methylase
MTLLQGNNMDLLRDLPDNSVHSVVTDPPYGLSFMGKKWDYDVPTVELWAECLRVLKPGGHLLAFAGTRTQHRMAVRIEDAGFEIRDMIAWVYGSGFPKSHDVSKAIDKMDATEEQQQRRLRFTVWLRSTGITAKQINEATNTQMASHYLTQKSQPSIMTREHLEMCRHLIENIPEWVEREADIRSVESRNFAERETIKTRVGVDYSKQRIAASKTAQGLEKSTKREFAITAPATEAARQWQGWGSALKPALEPITVARKPLIGTIAENVLQHGTGAINVDGCRVGTEIIKTCAKAKGGSFTSVGNAQGFNGCPESTHAGRWPANLIHDGGLDVVKELKSAARFFYTAKAGGRDRNANLDPDNPNGHPTVKPLLLMQYLVRLVTPPGGVVLDPFMGSGTTGLACRREGFDFIGMEREAAYFQICKSRIENDTDWP